MRPCLFCGRTDGIPTREHAIPKWARDAFPIKGPVTVSMGDSGKPTERIHDRAHLNYTLDDAICAVCNNGFLARLESEVKPILAPMAVEHRATILTVPDQQLLATWAIKTVFLLEYATRQKYERRPIVGYEPSELELAFLMRHEPPPRAQVWLGCIDARDVVALRYEPSLAPIPTSEGGILHGHVTSFALGYVAFQVFTIDILEAERVRAVPSWPPMPLAIQEAIRPIWPAARQVSWPSPAFADGDWIRFVTRDQALRTPSFQPAGYRTSASPRQALDEPI